MIARQGIPTIAKSDNAPMQADTSIVPDIECLRNQIFHYISTDWHSVPRTLELGGHNRNWR